MYLGNPETFDSEIKMTYNAEMETKTKRKARANKAWRQRRKDAGLCTLCGKVPPVANKSFCQSCLDKQGKIKRNRKDAGLCQNCGTYPTRNASTYCEICTNTTKN